MVSVRLGKSKLFKNEPDWMPNKLAFRLCNLHFNSCYHRVEAYYGSVDDYALERLLQDVHLNLEIIERLDYLDLMLPFEAITTNNLV